MTKQITFTGSTLRPRSVEEKALIKEQLHDKAWPLGGIPKGRCETEEHPTPNKAAASTATNSVRLVFIAINPVGVGLGQFIGTTPNRRKTAVCAGTEAGASELLTFPSAFLGPLLPFPPKIDLILHQAPQKQTYEGCRINSN